MTDHRKGYKRHSTGKGNWVSSFKVLAFPDAYIELLRVVEYDIKAELLAVEREYIRNNTCVNKNQPGRTDTQYQMDHVEEKAAYYIANSEKIRANVAAYQAAKSAKLHEKHDCDCGGCFTAPSKARHLRSAKHEKWVAE